MSDRRSILRLLLVLTTLWAAAGAAHAQLPPEQRRQMRQEMRERWREMPQEDRQRMREQRHERWQQMPQENRQRMREEMRGQRPPPPYGAGEGRGPRGGWR